MTLKNMIAKPLSAVPRLDLFSSPVNAAESVNSNPEGLRSSWNEQTQCLVGKKILAVGIGRDLELLATVLRREGHRLETASSDGALDRLRATLDLPNLILLDIDVFYSDAGERMIHEIRRQYPCASIFVSGAESADIPTVFGAGVDDCVGKACEPAELCVRIAAQLSAQNRIEHLIAVNQQLKALADTDYLTGLFNMRSIFKKLDLELRRTQLSGGSTGAVMLDLDFFKTINDTHDHLFGAFVISEVGKLIGRNIRKTDIAARFGGDEFLVVLTDTDSEGTAAFAERLRRRIEEEVFVSGQYRTSVTSSLGFAVAESGDQTMDAKTLVCFADHALYEAKRSGRNCVRRHVQVSPTREGNRQIQASSVHLAAL